MNFSESITTCMGKYATFKGRASRSEFWWFYLFTVLLSWGATIVDAIMTSGEASIISAIVFLVFMLPLIAAGTRRLHDIGKSGWWQLLTFTVIGILLLIFWWAKDTQKEENPLT